MMSDQEVYRRFIKWLDKAWWGLPESDHLMPTIKAFYTPEEASLLTGIPFSSRSLEELAVKKRMEPTELAPKLDALARRGVVWRSVKQGIVRYKLMDTMFTFLRGPFWAEKPHEATQALAQPLNKYFYDGFMEQNGLNDALASEAIYRRFTAGGCSREWTMEIRDWRESDCG